MSWSRMVTAITAFMILLSLAVILIALQIGLETPIGPEIAYVSKEDGSTWDIYLMDVERGVAYNTTAPFMPGPVRNRFPAWSPDGSHLAFVSEYAPRQRMDILVMNPAQLSLRILTDGRGDETMPVWSPNGQIVAYAVYNRRDWDIYLKRATDENIVLAQDAAPSQPILNGPDNTTMPVWSPDGSGLLFVSDRNGGRDIYVVGANGRDLRQLTNGMNLGESPPVWSPTGSHITFVSEVAPNREVYIVNVVSGAITNLSRHSAGDYAPVWSPDGERIAFVSTRDGDDDIYVMDADGGDVRQLTDNFYFDYAPVWSPDGRYIAYVSQPLFTTELYLVEVATGQTRRLTDNYVDDWYPAWRPE